MAKTRLPKNHTWLMLICNTSYIIYCWFSEVISKSLVFLRSVHKNVSCISKDWILASSKTTAYCFQFHYNGIFITNVSQQKKNQQIMAMETPCHRWCRVVCKFCCSSHLDSKFLHWRRPT